MNGPLKLFGNAQGVSSGQKRCENNEGILGDNFIIIVEVLQVKLRL